MRKPVKKRGIEIAHSYLADKDAVVRALWIRANQRNPIIKATILPPLAVMIFALTLLILSISLLLLTATYLGLKKNVPRDKEEL